MVMEPAFIGFSFYGIYVLAHPVQTTRKDPKTRVNRSVSLIKEFPMKFILTTLCCLALASPGFSEESQKEKTMENPRVIMETSNGKVVIELSPEKAPLSVENFLSYTREGFYDGTIFHRVIPGFMIQGGGFTPDMTKKSTKAPVKNESNNALSNDVGTIAMARTNNPDSATCQFFINTANNAKNLNSSMRGPGYTVFGHVVEGMEVVSAIEASPTSTHGHFRDVPTETISIVSMKVVGETSKDSE